MASISLEPDGDVWEISQSTPVKVREPRKKQIPKSEINQKIRHVEVRVSKLRLLPHRTISART
jgi:hypothetical protein